MTTDKTVLDWSKLCLSIIEEEEQFHFDDALVCDLRASKRISKIPETRITITQLTEEK